MSIKIRLVKEFDDYSPVVLGCLSHPSMDELQARQTIEDAWPAFQETEPDSDDGFLDWLVENFGFTKIEDDMIDIAV